MSKKEIYLILGTSIAANFIAGIILLYIEKKYFDEQKVIL